jgi:hypothetical protein
METSQKDMADLEAFDSEHRQILVNVTLWINNGRGPVSHPDQIQACQQPSIVLLRSSHSFDYDQN